MIEIKKFKELRTVTDEKIFVIDYVENDLSNGSFRIGDKINIDNITWTIKDIVLSSNPNIICLIVK